MKAAGRAATPLPLWVTTKHAGGSRARPKNLRLLGYGRTQHNNTGKTFLHNEQTQKKYPLLLSFWKLKPAN